MINSITLQKFRGFDELTIPLSRITMMTGPNGVGKTSVLEGLYCLFSETKLDVSFLTRYNRAISFLFNQMSLAARQDYNYKLYWTECPSYGEIGCSVSAKADDNRSWSWTYKKANMTDLDSKIINAANQMGLAIDSFSEFALWNWQVNGFLKDKRTHQVKSTNSKISRAQFITTDGGLHLIPMIPQGITNTSICRYLDFALIRATPKTLPFQTSVELTKALQIINPRVTDVRLTDAGTGLLSVILDNKQSVSLGTIGNGAVTWASALIAILEVTELSKSNDTPIFVLIDEIGAGIHYSVMLDMWKYLREFARQYQNIQFVTTSHSDDCVRAFCETFANQNIANLIRLHETSKNKIVSTKYDDTHFEKIISGEWEVRG